MALDGIVISSLVKEFNETLTGGKIAKIAQPENDELLLHKELSQPVPPSDFCRSKPSSDLPHRRQQAQPHDGPELLYAPPQAHRQRKNLKDLAAGPGAYHPF